MDFNWGKKFTELQEKQNRLGTQRAVISRSFIAHAIDHSLDEYRDEVVEMLQDRKKVLEELYSRHKLDIDEHRINEVERTITKLKEEK